MWPTNSEPSESEIDNADFSPQRPQRAQSQEKKSVEESLRETAWDRATSCDNALRTLCRICLSLISVFSMFSTMSNLS